MTPTELLNFVIGVLLGLLFASPWVSAYDDLVFVKTRSDVGEQAIFQMSLNLPARGFYPTKADTIVQESDGMSDVGFVYNYKTRSVVWSHGTEIRSLSIEDNKTMTLTDVSKVFSHLIAVNDVGVDGYGTIYFTANDTGSMGFIGKIDTSGTATQLYQGSTTNQVFSAIAVDPIRQSVFVVCLITAMTSASIKRLEGSTLTDIITISDTITSIAIDIDGQLVYYSDGFEIYYTNYTTLNGQNRFYQYIRVSYITDIDVIGRYVYYVGRDSMHVYETDVGDDMASSVIALRIDGISWVDVVSASKSVILCDTTGIPHATVSADCESPMAGVSCDYTCDNGYEKNPLSASLTCGDNTGLWDLSTPCRAKDDFILVREHGNLASQRDVFMIPLNESGTTENIKVVDLADGAISNGVIFDGFRRSVIYSVGGVIKTLSIDGDAESTLADLSTGDFMFNQVSDLSLDTTSGDIYFAGSSGAFHGTPQRKGSIGVINTDNVVMALYNTTDVFLDMITDSVNRLIFAAKRLTGGTTYTLVKMDFDGTNEAILKANFQNLHCIAIDYVEQKVLWSDVYANIYKIGYDGSNEVKYYTALGPGKRINDMKVVGDYIYYIGGTSTKISKVHRIDASVETEFEPRNGLRAMKFLDVPTEFGSPITGCSVEDLGNTTLPENCSQLGGSCNMSNIECGYGYKKNSTIVHLMCSLSGIWNVQLSTLCNEILCPTTIPHGNLSDTCGRHFGDSCSSFTCDYSYHKETAIEPFNCTDDGIWDYNLTSLCKETLCDSQIPNGNLSGTCETQVGDSCDAFICDYGYNETKDAGAFNCTEDGSWDYNVSLLCVAILCPTVIPNGNLSDSCGRRVGDSCSSFNCDFGYHQETGVEPFNCSEAGTWDNALNTLCIETVCDRHIPNGHMSDECDTQVGDSCDAFTCDYGYNETEGLGSFNCTEDGSWDYNVSLLCVVPVTVTAATTSAMAHVNSTMTAVSAMVTLKDTGIASGPTSSMKAHISISTTSTATTSLVRLSTTQQSVSVGESPFDEPVFLVSASMITGAILALSGVLLVMIIKRCITRRRFGRTPVAPMNNATEA